MTAIVSCPANLSAQKVTVSLSDVQGLHDKTGQWVGLIGADYFGWTAGQATTTVVNNVNSFLIDYWNNGGLVAMEMHVYNPFTGGHSWDVNNVNLVDLISGSHTSPKRDLLEA